MTRYTGPLLTHLEADALNNARKNGESSWTGSFDLGRSISSARLGEASWEWCGVSYPYADALKLRTINYWDGEEFSVVARFGSALYKLVPTDWGAPTFEIDGIKMLPTAQVSPYEDARRKVALVQARGKPVLDTCGGLGYFAAACLEAGASQIRSFEKSNEVLWLRSLNSWSPDPDAASSGGRLTLTQGDVTQTIVEIADATYDVILHDPPRFGIAGELYSQAFYDQLARVMKRGGRMFHYTGAPNRLTSGRDVPREVSRRLNKSGFKTELAMDGVLARKS